MLNIDTNYGSAAARTIESKPESGSRTPVCVLIVPDITAQHRLTGNINNGLSLCSIYFTSS